MANESKRIVEDAARLLASAPGPAAASAREALTRLDDGQWTVLVSGLRSTGKSSLVSTLWGDSALLPTAVQDCTQTNTLLRVPAGGEADRRIVLRFLPREEAIEFASRDLAYHRLEEVIREVSGLLGMRLDEMSPGERVHWATSTVRRLFAERPDVHVLHEPAIGHVEKLEQFLEFIDSPAYHPGGEAEVAWEERRDYLMGRRRPDGRTLDAGKLLSLRLVELVRSCNLWEGTPPRLIDSPWIPTFHNARRADLILREAKGADILVIVALPEVLTLEPWVEAAFRMRPELARRTVVVFNQLDTIDATQLYSRGGFAEVWQKNAEMLSRHGVNPRNVLCSCARLPFLAGLPAEGRGQAFESSRQARLEAVLAKIRRLASDRVGGNLTARLIEACDPADAGVGSLRRRLLDMSRTDVPAGRLAEASASLIAAAEAEPSAERAGEMRSLARRAADLSSDVLKKAGLPAGNRQTHLTSRTNSVNS